MNQDDFKSAYYGGLTVFMEWKDKHEQEMQRAENEDALRMMIALMPPQVLEDMMRHDPDVKAVVKKFVKKE